MGFAQRQVSHGSPIASQKYPAKDLLPAPRSALNAGSCHRPAARIHRTLYEMPIRPRRQRGEKVLNSYGVMIPFPKKVDFRPKGINIFGVRENV